MNYYPTRVTKNKPQKKIPETDDIFAQLAKVNPEADKASETLRISLDAKAQVKIGPFSRGGKNRVSVEAADHDFDPEDTLMPFGIFLPALDELFLYFTLSRVTSDFIVDVLEMWWESVRERFSHIKTLVLNLDNGPENHSRRTQFMKRLVEFARKYQLNIQLGADTLGYHFHIICENHKNINDKQ